jgi:hypothetical protein
VSSRYPSGNQLPRRRDPRTPHRATPSAPAANSGAFPRVAPVEPAARHAARGLLLFTVSAAPLSTNVHWHAAARLLVRKSTARTSCPARISEGRFMAETPTDSLRQTQTPPHAGPHGLELPVAAQRLAWLLARAAAQPRHDVANVRELATAAGLSIRALQYTCARAGATARDCAALVRCLRLVLDGGCWDPVSALSSSDPRTIRRLIHRAALGGERPSVLAFLGRQQLLRQPETRRFLLAELYALDRRLHPNARSLPTTTVV